MKDGEDAITQGPLSTAPKRAPHDFAHGWTSRPLGKDFGAQGLPVALSFPSFRAANGEENKNDVVALTQLFSNLSNQSEKLKVEVDQAVLFVEGLKVFGLEGSKAHAVP